ncbi:hypothetical protein [Pseudooceanicola sp.]|uniref:hypothetical protein n=1 Tax=Pseudooceanicola sp. TaxID=1914328 RepID=UPI0035198C40
MLDVINPLLSIALCIFACAMLYEAFNSGFGSRKAWIEAISAIAAAGVALSLRWPGWAI